MKIFAVFKKDYLVETSYKFAFILQIVGVFAYICAFYFLSELVGKDAEPYLRGFGSDYFSFVLLGIIFSNYMFVCLNSFSEYIRKEQTTGTIEAVLAAPTDPFVLLLYSFLWPLFVVTFETIIYIVLSILVFDLKILNINLLSLFVVLALTVISFGALGIISAGFIIIFKRGDPVNFLINSAFTLLGGVFFPVSILPPWLKVISNILPITYSLDSLRLSIVMGYSLKRLFYPDILFLLVFSALVLPLSLFVFNFAVKAAKKQGSLIKY